MPEHPPGTIGILSGDLMRWGWFFDSMLAAGQQLPPGTQIVHVSGQWVADAVNSTIAQMRPEDEWYSVVADDHICEPDIFCKLLDHHLPIVAPLVCLRSRGFHPSLFHELPNGEFRSYRWGELAGKTGLLAVDTYGGPFSVIRREVIETIGMPFYQCMPGKRTAPHEDLYAFSRCRKAGFQPWVDLDIRLGHCIPAAVFPTQDTQGNYGVRVWSQEDLGYLFMDERQAIKDEQPYHAMT